MQLKGQSYSLLLPQSTSLLSKCRCTLIYLLLRDGYTLETGVGGVLEKQVAWQWEKSRVLTVGLGMFQENSHVVHPPCGTGSVKGQVTLCVHIRCASTPAKPQITRHHGALPRGVSPFQQETAAGG